jgi:hypothetical protein
MLSGLLSEVWSSEMDVIILENIHQLPEVNYLPLFEIGEFPRRVNSQSLVCKANHHSQNMGEDVTSGCWGTRSPSACHPINCQGYEPVGKQQNTGKRNESESESESESGPLRAVHLSRHKWPGISQLGARINHFREGLILRVLVTPTISPSKAHIREAQKRRFGPALSAGGLAHFSTEMVKPCP